MLLVAGFGGVGLDVDMVASPLRFAIRDGFEELSLALGRKGV
jgi:hypothetical protein